METQLTPSPEQSILVQNEQQTAQTPPAEPPQKPERRRPRGKISRLPRATRNQLNLFMDEGITYSEIILKLGDPAAHLNEMDLSRWYQNENGFQQWLKNQAWIENATSRLDLAADVSSQEEAASLHLANLHIAATQLIHDLLKRGEALLEDHPGEYVQLVDAVSRISREALNHQKYREACLQARAELAKLKDPNRNLSQEETLAIVDKLDHILGFK